MANVITERFPESVNARPTYSKYQELLQAQRAKTVRLFNGWTKAGRCELVAKEILERLGDYWGIKDPADKDLLLEVLNTEVLPNVDKKCRAHITRQLDSVLSRCNKICRRKILTQKDGDLRKILSPGDVAYIMRGLDKEEQDDLTDQLHTLFVEKLKDFKDIKSCYDSLGIIPRNEILGVVSLLNCINIYADKVEHQIYCLRNMMAECAPDEMKVISELLNNMVPAKAAALIEMIDLSHAKVSNILEIIKNIPTKEMRNAFIDQIPTILGDLYLSCSHHSSDASVLLHLFLFPNEGDRINQAHQLYYFVHDLPVQKQVALILQAQRLYAGLSPLVGNALDAVVLLKDKIPENERENFIAQIPSLVEEVNRLNWLANNVKLQVLSFIFQRVTSVERSGFIQHLGNLMVPNVQDHLETLLALPANERADRVEAINLQYGLINRPPEVLIVDPADFSDEARNPTRPLLQLFEEIDQKHRFPRIQYQNSVGSDAGGLTRDFVSQIFQALCHPDQKSLPLMASDGRYLPTVEVSPPPTLPLDDQIKCYKAIGMLFARAINGDPSLVSGKDSVTTGTHFHSNMFAMVHALTLDEMKLIPDPLMDDSVPDIKLKLTKLYLKTQFPELFRPIGIEESVVDNEIAKLMNGEVSQRLQASGVDEDFLKDYRVNAIIQATLVIAKSMHKTLAFPDQWAGVVGNSPEALSNKIEGSLTSDLAIGAFGLKNEAEDTRKGMVKRWIRTASPEALKNFVFGLTGSTSLSPGQKLGVELCEVLNNPENAPVFHTCGQYMDLPRYETYEIFEAKLAISIASATAGGFQLA